MKDSMGGSLKFEAEFFRKSNNLLVAREKKIRSIQVRTVHLLLLLALTLLAGLVIFKAADFLLSCDALQVHSFRLRHQPVYAGEKVNAILRHFGGNILAMDLGELQAQLLQVPEIAGASIRRILPDTVEIEFALRRPFYQYYKDGFYRLLDADGLELGRQQQEPIGLISVRGAGPAAAAIACFSRELRPLREQIEYVACGEPHGIELKLRGASEIFYPGEDDFVGKINRYFRIKSRLPLDLAAIRSVDLRIPGRIYFEFQEQEEQRGNP
jgi:cell division septal protein FtsQ